MTQRVTLQPAYVLSRRAYRETSLLLEVFSRDHGRVGLVARGAQAPRSKLRGLLEPLRPVLLSWSERGELGSLTGAEAAEGDSLPLAGEAVFCGWYLNELLLRLTTRHDPHPMLFGHLADALNALRDPPHEPVLRLFEKRLLDELGYGLQLPDDLDAQAHYRYDWDEGPQAAAASDRTYSGACLSSLARESLSDPKHWRAAKRLLREALARHGAGRELETPKLLRALRDSLKPARAAHA